ncbi:Propeller [Mactra antiquata]
MSVQQSEGDSTGMTGSSQGECHTELLREVEPLTDLLSNIPSKVQRGLNTHYEKLELTALDANKYFIALGSQVGTVFLYDRSKCSIQRLKSDSTTDSVSCVCLHHGLDDLVAVGYTSGTIYIFQLPSLMIGHSKQLERFVINDVHKHRLTCLTWSTNGMRLYSGDIHGYVGCAEVDFYERECKSSVILIESNTEIVQLDHGHKSLIVSTKHRSILYRFDQHESITQIGTKDRKIIGDFGACFIPAMCKPEDAMLYASRPGYRVWKASVNGSVQHTYMYKDLLLQEHHQFQLLPYNVTNINKSIHVNQFGPVLLYQDKFIVTWSDMCFYVLNPENSSIIGSQNHCGFIRSVVVTETEIFILRQGTDRNIIRLSNQSMTKPTHQLLKQLEADRLAKEIPSVPVSRTPEHITKVTEHSPDRTSKSSGFHPGNFLEKVEKVITKPSTLVDKLQEKLNIDKKSPKHVASESSSNKEKQKKPSPDWLPPIVQLNSPSLIDIEIGVKLETVSQSEHKNDNLDSVSTVNQSLNKTGTGAISALAKLQEDHRAEEIYEAAGSRRSQLEESVAIGNTMELEPVYDDDELVVHKKVKAKHKKKKKEKKEKRRSDVIDIDSVSVNSSSSITSDLSELSTRTDNSEVKHIAGTQHPGTIPETKTEVDSGFENSVNDVVLDESSELKDLDRTIDNSVGVNDKEADCAQNDAIIESIVDVVNARDTLGVNGKRNDTEQAEMEREEHLTTGISPEQKVVQNNKNEGPTESPKSNIDPSWLEKYIEDDSNSLNEGAGKLNELKSDTIQRMYLDACKDTRTNEEKERDVLNSLLESDTQYVPSRLEQQLSQLEKTTLGDDDNDDNTVDDDNDEKPDYTRQISTTSMTSSDGKPSIYSIYNRSGTNISDLYSQFDAMSPTGSISEVSDKDKMARTVFTYKTEDDADFNKLSKTQQLLKCFNTWTELSTQGNIHSISVSSSHVWITDKSYNIFYSSLSSPGVTWRKANGSATQIAVSPDGYIVWALHKNTVMAGTKITSKRPEGMKWVEAVRDVAYICVDNRSAWYIKTNQQLMMQSRLSKDRPCFTGVEVDCSHRLKQILCHNGVVWALTENCCWLYRDGITPDRPAGTSWCTGDSSSENRLFSHLALGEDGYGWAVDIIGQVWFRCGVTMEKPRGDKYWWQVPIGGEYMMKDMTAFDMLKSFSKKFDPQKLTVLLSSQNGGLIAAGTGVWVCPEYKNVLHVCRGSIEGQLWTEAHPETLAPSSCWKTVVASTADNLNGLVWAQQPNGDIFAFSSNRQNCTSIPGPSLSLSSGLLFACISVCTDALWGLTHSGQVFIRTGMSELEPRGTGWSELDLSQLEDTQIVSVSCSNLNVWSVDSDGGVWHRIGVRAPTDLSLNAAWLPVENGGTVFTQVISGPQEWKVWAIDNRRQVYVRSGITQNMPIGRKWIHVSGSPAMHLTLSNDFVFAVNHGGELLCRYGVTPDNVTGDYWKKLPGELTYISAMADDTLWGINKDGQLVKRYTKHIMRQDHDPPVTSLHVSRRSTGNSVGSDECDWEFV